MKIYYYHTRPIQEALDEWKNHLHPGHILYGLTHFSKHGIHPILHHYRHFASRIRFSLYNFFEIIRCKEPYDLLYGTSFYGLELIIFLRAFGLYRKPIAIWHHQAVVRNFNKLKNLISRFYYRGIDQMFFFSQTLIEDSLKSGKVNAGQVQVGVQVHRAVLTPGVETAIGDQLQKVFHTVDGDLAKSICRNRASP